MDFIYKPLTAPPHPPPPTATSIPGGDDPIGVPRPVDTYLHPTPLGHLVLWVVFAIFTVATASIGLFAFRVEKRRRAFHLITGVVTGIAALSYLALAQNLFVIYTPAPGAHHAPRGGHTFRPIYTPRFVDWALTTPLLVLDLALLAGLPWLDTVFYLIADEAMIWTGFIAAVHLRMSFTWVWYAISCVFFLHVLYGLVIEGNKVARLQSNQISRLYHPLSTLTVLLWLAYPVVFALGVGTGIIPLDVEVILYAVLDVSAKAGFGAWLLLQHGQVEQDEHAAVLPDSWVEPRGSQGGYGAILGEGPAHE